MGDPIIPGNEPYCGSSTNLSMLGNELFDLVITDPPFGNNLFYADLADFFYAWLRIPLRQWYAGLPESTYFESERTPHSMEAIDNPAEHPDDREGYEKDQFVDPKYLSRIRDLTEDITIAEKDLNPLYRPQPSSDIARPFPQCGPKQVVASRMVVFGVTSNLIKRIWEHKNNLAEGFTKRNSSSGLV